MRNFVETLALLSIAESRKHLADTADLLSAVADDVEPYTGSPVIGLPEVHAVRLRKAEEIFGLMVTDDIVQVAGPDVGEAVRGYRRTLLAMAENYGLACGPSRSLATAEALTGYMRRIAGEARGYLAIYASRIKGLEEPSAEAVEEANAAVLRDLEHMKGKTGPKPARDGSESAQSEVIARRARGLLGYAFGGYATSYLGFRRAALAGHPYGGLPVLQDFSKVRIAIEIGTRTLRQRTAIEDQSLLDPLDAAADEIGRIYRQLSDQIMTGPVAPGALEMLAVQMIASTARLGEAITTFGAIADTRGYDLRFRDPPAR